MDEQLNHAPCGFITLNEDGTVSAVNQTLLSVLGYESEQLTGQHIKKILTVPSHLFYQLYFDPLIKAGKQVEEMYLSLKSAKEDEIPVLVNASRQTRDNQPVVDCVLILMRKRNEYENELLIAKKEAEAALAAENEAKNKLEMTYKSLATKQEKLLELNRQNEAFKTETEKELKLAKKTQETLLTAPLMDERLQIEAYYRASSELSGDMYGFYEIRPGTFGIILLDVMGHGIPSALITMSLHSLFQKLIPTGEQVGTVMKELDRHLHSLFLNNEEAWHYCTAIYLLVDTANGKIEYANAGHPPALIQDKDGNKQELTATAPPLGAFEETIFKSHSIPYTKGNRLLLYTDGVADPVAPDSLYALMDRGRSLSLAELKEEILQLLKKEENAYHENDDQCFILADLT